MSFTIETSARDGWFDRDEHYARKELEKQLAAAKADADKKNDQFRREREKHGQAFQSTIKEVNAAMDKVAELEEMLAGDTVFVKEGIAYTGHMVTDPDFSIAEHCGRFFVDKSRVGFSVDMYHDTDTAESVPEGEPATLKMLTDYMHRVATEGEDRIKFEDILGVGEFIRDDDPEALKIAKESTHRKHIINAENKAILAKLAGAKDAVKVDFVEAAINAHLCGKAKRGAEIWTNKAGFAALDVTDVAGGYPLIQRNADGDFVFRGKYIVREFPDAIMPNTANGAPVLIGDFKNIVRFAVDNPRYLEKHDIYNAIVYDRLISYEIPVLTTTSDEAYINGFIAVEG